MILSNSQWPLCTVLCSHPFYWELFTKFWCKLALLFCSLQNRRTLAMNLVCAGYMDYLKTWIALCPCIPTVVRVFSFHTEARGSEGSHVTCLRLPQVSPNGLAPWCSQNHKAFFPHHISLSWCFHLNTRSQILWLVSGGCSLTTTMTLVLCGSCWIMFAWHYWAPWSTCKWDPVGYALPKEGMAADLCPWQIFKPFKSWKDPAEHRGWVMYLSPCALWPCNFFFPQPKHRFGHKLECF
jgi:hypothetical protein